MIWSFDIVPTGCCLGIDKLKKSVKHMQRMVIKKKVLDKYFADMFCIID